MHRTFAAWILAVAVPVAAQDPGPGPGGETFKQRVEELNRLVDRLSAQIADLELVRRRLTQENGELSTEVERLRQAGVEAAREILMLRQALKDATPPAAVKPAETTEPAPPGTTTPPPLQDVPAGPKEVLRAKVWAVDPHFGFVLINKGEPDGVKPGFRFDIVRRVRVKGDGPNATEDFRLEKLGIAEFEKFIGTSKGQSKLKLVEGRAQDMKYEDEAIAHRKIEPEEKGSGPAPATPSAPASNGKSFQLTGKVGDSYMLNYGAQDGARQTDRVYVYRENRLRAHLRLDVVEKDYSIGRLIDRTQNGDFGVGDAIQLKEIRAAIVGRIKWNDDRRGILIEAGLKDGVKPGMKFEVRRQGRPIGMLVIKRADAYLSEAEPVGDLKRDEVFVEDFVESVD